jgi:hypothetical protein
MGFFSLQFAFYISQNPVIQSVYKFLFVKRPRNSNEILIEPTDSNHWLCESQMIFTALSSFDLKEQYYISLESYFETMEKENALVIYSLPMNFNDTEKVYRIIRNQRFSFRNLQEPKLSSVSLLDIQYHHPDMKESLILIIPKEWCCIENELFSPEFVLRMLYYQTLPFVFDMNYTLDIMDSDLNMFQLYSNQWMLLKDTNYEIITL